MIETASELPPAVVSDLFSVCLTTAHTWEQPAQTNWAVVPLPIWVLVTFVRGTHRPCSHDHTGDLSVDCDLRRSG
ncbi:hypothetical protein BJY24_006421 [Nocardia transvalensis]|uniref:Uncharacterized protein n=1 Tax=Nocardia transvalensis TaxID=37333 RepID=A0A7W9ULG1_9NOCA|nr:hypothetical protein [Nocardia transvalensis]MBB5917509.1 hypothetical protein [Nocardia transvalensis]